MIWTNRRRALKALAIKLFYKNWLRCTLLVMISLSISYVYYSFAPSFKLIDWEQASKLPIMDLLRMINPIPIPVTPQIYMFFAVLVLLYLFIVIPLQVGSSAFYLKIAKGEKPSLKTVFKWYANLNLVFGSIGMYLWIGLFSVLWGILIFGLPVSLMLYINTLSSPSILMLAIDSLSIFAFLFGIVIYNIKLCSYAAAIYLYSDNPRIGIRYALKQSIWIMKGNVVEYFFLTVSFIGWIIVNALAYGVLSIILEPYYRTSTALFVENARINYFNHTKII